MHTKVRPTSSVLPVRVPMSNPVQKTVVLVDALTMVHDSHLDS
jgi:hypothetical protein